MIVASKPKVIRKRLNKCRGRWWQEMDGPCASSQCAGCGVCVGRSGVWVDRSGVVTVGW